MLSQEQLADLRAKAEAATPGPWEKHEHCSFVITPDFPHIPKIGSTNMHEDAAFIAAANPQAILQLLNMVERLEKEADWLAEQCENIEVELYAITDPNTIDHISSSMSKSPSEWREAARNAVEESQ